ncbi:hypothetical protein MRY87_00460 [bacterium]|nr:hypothetical protein [bacterium]
MNGFSLLETVVALSLSLTIIVLTCQSVTSATFLLRESSGKRQLWSEKTPMRCTHHDVLSEEILFCESSEKGVPHLYVREK